MVFPLDLILFLYPASSCIHLSECFLQITSAFPQQVPYSRKTLWKTTRSFSLPSQTWVWATTSCIARRSHTLWNLSSPTTPFRLCRKVSCPPTPTPPQWCFFFLSFFFFWLDLLWVPGAYLYSVVSCDSQAGGVMFACQCPDCSGFCRAGMNMEMRWERWWVTWAVMRWCTGVRAFVMPPARALL